jgi:hypothetical protein
MAQPPSLWNGGRIFNLPGLSRDNAPQKAVDPGLIARVSAGVRGWLGMNTTPGAPEVSFFPPGQPMTPIAPSAVGRAFDYPTNYNAQLRARSYEPIDFETLRALAEPASGGWDLIRLAIETRKDQMAKLTFSILPRKPPDAQLRAKSDSRCNALETFFRRPDGQHSWAEWLRMLLEEHLVIDAATIYCHRTLGGDVARLQILDGATIKPILGYDGRRPAAGPAYTQILKGLPAVNYTADELVYAPRNPRAHKVYGYSPTEQVLVTINIGLRRQVSQLAFFTEGNVPDAVAQVPPDWSISKIQEFQDYWDTIVNDAVRRRKMKFIPAGVQFQPTRNDQALVDAFDEWLARVVQYCFSLPPTPLVKQVNRATAESAYEQSLDEGLQPLMVWVKSIIDHMIGAWFGHPDLELVFDDIRKTDPAEKEARDIPLIQQGVISRDDLRADRGLEPLGIPPVVQGIGPLGFMSVQSMIKAIEQGWDLNGVQPAALPGMPGAPGSEQGADLAQLGTGGPGDPLANLPPPILEALGVAPPPDGAGGIANDDSQPDPTGLNTPKQGLNTPQQGATNSNVIPIHKHPQIQAALRTGEAHARRLADRMAGQS